MRQESVAYADLPDLEVDSRQTQLSEGKPRHYKKYQDALMGYLKK